jgi:DNA polymerase-3 subunit gamma/tau
LLTIGFDPQFEDHLSLVDNARNHTLLQTKLNELGRPNAQVKFIKAEAKNRPAPPTPPPAPAQKTTAPAPVATAKASPATATPAKEKLSSVPFSQDEFKNDPLIQKALEMFKAQIVEVRA